MLLWILFAVLTALVLVALLSPLRRQQHDIDAERRSFDLAVYRDQLSELDRDQQAGLIGSSEADAARNEVSRRILAAGADSKSRDVAEVPVPAWVAVATVIAVPALALGAYLQIGRPDLPAQPLQARIAHAVENQDMAAMVRQVEMHLETEPNDPRGWIVLAPAYKRMGRFEDAANAYRKALSLSGPNAQLMTDLGETLVLGNDGLVNNDAQKIFRAAQQVDPSQMKARFYIALALQQEGKTSDALANWKAMLTEGPADAPWREVVQQQIAAAGGELPKGPALTQEQMQAGQQMQAGDRTAMIRTMVEGLDERLAADGSDIDGWLRLIRARMVLGEKDKALEALDRAGEALKADPTALARLEDTRKALGF
jgi:cytochrome c-type biogenesis protein CcmH